MQFRRNRLPQFCSAQLCLLMVGLVCCSQSSHAQTGQVISQSGSAAASGSRTQPAPWRPHLGTLARQNFQQQPNTTMPARQPTQTTSGLPLPNSPVGGINLQNGTGTLPSTQPPATTTQPSNQRPANPPAQAPVTGTQPTNPPATNTALPNPNQSTNPNPNQITNQTQQPQQQFETVPVNSQRSITRVTKSMSQLPNDAGQVWREYDITPYTNSIQGINDPQQAILDWILKETGTEMWFNQPLGILNADRNQLRVYHTPEIQKIVHSIVDRFVNTKGQVQNLEVSLITIGKPNWRAAAYSVLQPIEVQSPGVEAWMVSKENAALLRASLARRGDFKDHGTGRIAHNDGQSVVLRKTQPVQFIRNFRWVTGQIPAYQPLVTTVDEGYTLEISSLSSLDGRTVEASIQCHVDQVEKLNTVKVDVPGAIGATTDRISLQIPQLVSWRLQERFRWRDDQVLLLSCGVVANPGPESSSAINLPRVLGGSKQRSDALLFVDYRGPQLPGNVPQNSADLRTVPVNRR